MSRQASLKPWQKKVHEIIFEADTFWGKAFDVSLMVMILASVASVMLETVDSIQERYTGFFAVSEWIFTIFFTIEYILRLLCVRKPIKYATSFFGVVDLLSILPTYLSIFFGGTHYLMVIRALRLLRVFRIFKLVHFINEGNILIEALKASQRKIMVFLTFILLLVIILGSIMYLVEGDADSGFTSIPRSIYWAVVTLTTVGYGDIAPVTSIGQFLAAIVMIMGYAVIAVPTGIVSSELTAIKRDEDLNTHACPSCSKEGHDNDAGFCKYCGEKFEWN